MKLARQHLVFAVVALVLVAGFVSWKQAGSPFPSKPPVASEALRTYEVAGYGLSFSYSPYYYLTSRDAGSPVRPQRAVVLIEDTPLHRDLVEGRATEWVGEGPTVITVDAFENSEGYSVEEWLREATNWKLATSDLQPVSVGGASGVSFTWTGLYEGRSAVVARDGRIFVFSVTWLTLEDRILQDYEALLASARFAS
jgi:hypothetical protein